VASFLWTWPLDKAAVPFSLIRRGANPGLNMGRFSPWYQFRGLLQIKSLHNRCKRMETIVVSWQIGIRFSVKRKLSLYRCFPSKQFLTNWRYRSQPPETVSQPVSIAADLFHWKWTVSVLFVLIRFQNRYFTQERTFQFLHAGFSLQIRLKQEVATDIGE
jgi:hypothetical protein